MFPNFNAWHKVPKDADIPAQTPYFMADDGELLSYFGKGRSARYPAGERDRDLDYYTEERIPSPEEESVEKRARTMYYSMPDSAEWEYEPLDIQEAWLDLARKYVEK